MDSGVEKIVMEALELPTGARAYVAERLLESLDAAPGEQLSPEWKAEVLRRCREIDAGQAQMHDADAVFRRAFAALG